MLKAIRLIVIATILATTFATVITLGIINPILFAYSIIGIMLAILLGVVTYWIHDEIFG